jgi:hypothetical protein
MNKTSSGLSGIAWTLDQLKVIKFDPSQKILVDAGPGTGKTATACARVAWLIEEIGIEPNQILITSFTNAAINEIRGRIGSFLTNPNRALEIRISTLDSFAWNLRAGFNVKESKLEGFDENIMEASELLSLDENAKEYIQTIGHLIVDEAQDMTGMRANIVLEIISNLQANTGVSVFSDDAQAIYGFSEEGKAEFFGNTLPEEIRSSDIENSLFNYLILQEIHRTTDEKLKRLFKDGRAKLLFENDVPVDELYKNVRELIIETNHERKGSAFEILVKEGNASALKSSDFLLFRRRSDALQSSHYMGAVPHKLRLSGYPSPISPWIARCFWNFAEDRISESEFADLYGKRVDSSDLLDIETKWKHLHREVGVDKNRISLRKLSNLLSRPNVPDSFLMSDYGIAGPTLGTIHASKGRETENVYLFVPSEPNFEKDFEDETRIKNILEEARILFVGATRARKTLVISDKKSIGNFRNSRVLDRSKRSYTIKNATKKHCAIELGRNGDISPEDLVGKKFFSDNGDASLAQIALWNRREVSTPLKANTSSRDKDFAYEVSIDYQYQDSRYVDSLENQKFQGKVFYLNKSVNSDIFFIGKWKMNQRLKPPSQMKYFYSLGTRSLVLSTDNPARDLLLEPWSSTGFMLAPILVGYPDIYLEKY